MCFALSGCKPDAVAARLCLDAEHILVSGYCGCLSALSVLAAEVAQHGATQTGILAAHST